MEERGRASINRRHECEHGITSLFAYEKKTSICITVGEVPLNFGVSKGDAWLHIDRVGGGAIAVQQPCTGGGI